MVLYTSSMRIYFYCIGVVAFGLFAVIPEQVAHAQTALVPACANSGACNVCDIVQVANNIIKWLFALVTFVFAILMLRAGFGLVTSKGNVGALEDAKSSFTNAIVGLLIAMSAWLVVDTLMRQLLDGGTGEIEGYGPWSEVRCVLQTQSARTGRDYVDGVTPPAGDGERITHETAVGRLDFVGISVYSSGRCSDKTRRECTSLDGIRQLTIDRILELQAVVGTTLVVTGGTEVGHAAGTYSHANGYKIDLRIDPVLNEYITTNYTPVSGTTNKWKDDRGNIYYRHGPPDHWDVTVTQ